MTADVAIDAVIFDFDGLILDTETPLYEAWRGTYQHFGVDPIDLDLWVQSLGLPSDDPKHIDRHGLLEERLGRPLREPDVTEIRRRLRDQLLHEQPIMPGVVELLDQADQAGLGIAIASSSPQEWVEQHLGPRGLLERFEFLSCASAVLPGKPDPATYANACRRLGVNPARAIGLEDSPHGCHAAKAAGMAVIACPNPISFRLDFSHADRVVAALTDVDLGQPLGS